MVAELNVRLEAPALPWDTDEHYQVATQELFSFSWARVTPVGLWITTRSIDWQTYDDDVNALITHHNASQWSIGDAYRFGLMAFKKDQDPTQVFTARNVRIKTIQNYAWVCNQYAYQERMWPPSFSHHSVIAKLQPDRRRHLLSKCVRQDWTVEDLDEYTRVEREIIEKSQNQTRKPFEKIMLEMLTERYNSAVQVFQKIPDWPERAMIQRGLKMIEQGIEGVNRRTSGKD